MACSIFRSALSVLLAAFVAVVLVAIPARAQPVTASSCNAVPTFADALAPLRELHVAPPPRGDNARGDGSEKRPYATIQFAAARATPGSAVRVHPGVYNGGISLGTLHAREDAPIWIGGADPASRPVIEGGANGFHLSRARYVILHDLEIRNATGNGVNSDDGGEYANPDAAHHQVFRSLLIHSIGGNGNQDGLKLSGIRHFVVDNCEIARCGGAMSGSGIDMVGCHHGVIARSSLHDLSGNGVQTKGGTSDVEIRWCRLTSAGERALNIGGSTGFEFFRPPLSPDAPNAEARDIRAYANVIVGASTPVAFVGAVECRFSHNTVVNPRTWLLRILQETTSTPAFDFMPCSDNIVASNIIYFERSVIRTHLNIGGGTSPATFDFANNLWFAHDTPAASRPTLPAPETDGIYAVDPLLLHPATGECSIRVGSPAAGRARVPAPLAGDAAGRCYLTPASIGAFEVPIPTLK